MKYISRRTFLKFLGLGAAGIVANPKLSVASRNSFLQASDVIQCYDENATSGSAINQTAVQIMMDESIKTLVGIADVGEAWKSIFPGITENSVIGIKVNAAWYPIPTHPEFVNCIVNGLTQMDFNGTFFPRNNVIMWDRTDTDLTDSGYTIYTGTDPATIRCFGTNHAGVGYDSGCQLRVQYPGGESTKYPSRIMSVMCDYLINVAVLKNHGTAQVTLTLKNHYGSINQPVGNPLHYDYCDPSIASLNQQIRDQVTPNNIQKIFIIDALWGSVTQGPVGNPDWNPKKIIMSLDTVACDYQGWNLINDERVNSGYSPISWPVYHIDTASQQPYNLGTTAINLIEINNPTGIQEHKTLQPGNGILRISPNPCRDNVTAHVSLTRPSGVDFDLVDASGRVVSNIFSGQLSAGSHDISYALNRNLKAGTYFLRMYNQGTSHIKKFTVVR
jgi:hypothetical protein